MGLESLTLSSDQKGLLLSNRALCFLKLSRYQRSLEGADACLQLLPEHVKSLSRRAVALEHLGRPEEALQDFARVARAEPQNLQAVQAARRLREELARKRSERREAQDLDSKSWFKVMF